ncbi:unknown [Prevotella sp. CAG:1185]|nr:unknown [Prevotella sp. CAG:1185]
MDDLRKVKFTLEQFNGTIGDYESAGENAENVMKERTGVFYCWGNEPIFDSVTGTYHDRTIGVVEEYSTGKVYHVIPKFMTFLETLEQCK